LRGGVGVGWGVVEVDGLYVRAKWRLSFPGLVCPSVPVLKYDRAVPLCGMGTRLSNPESGASTQLGARA
jgi:hypothetical protein